MKKITAKRQNRIRLILVYFLFVVALTALTVRLGQHMIIDGEEYADKATGQQTSDTLILATRGSIVDRNGAELAISATTHTIWVRPDSVKGNGDTQEEAELNMQLEAKALAETLGMEYDAVMEVFESDKKLLRLAKNVDGETADAVRAQQLAGIEISEDAKRYYPLGAFASQVIGSTTDDNAGLSGIELKYNSFLAGKSGRWIKNKDNRRNSLAYGTDTYYGAEDGYTAVLAIDQNIQYIITQEIEAAKERTGSSRVMCLMMDPATADILGCAQTGEYDPNDPREPIAGDEEAFAAMSSEERLAYWNRIWRNFLMCDTYEPGSTFKLITTSIALDNNVTYPGEIFYCPASVKVADRVLKCWNYPHAHGYQTLSQAVQNSCNVTMVALVQRIGLSKFFEGIDSFGMSAKTEVDYPGEGVNILQDKYSAGPVGLATMSYGQGIAVTPISLVTAVSSIANGGKMMQPRFVKELRYPDGTTAFTYEPEIKGRSISSQTAADVLSIMEDVCTYGYGGRLRVPGFRIGGKTGTANKPEGGAYSETDVYASFIGVAPVDDPKFVILVICDSPRGVLYGSSTAGPCAVNIISRTLQYMGLSPEYTKEELAALHKTKVDIPDVTGEEGEVAIGRLNALGLEAQLMPAIETSARLVVVDQFPKAGTEVDKGYTVTLYYETEAGEDASQAAGEGED